MSYYQLLQSKPDQEIYDLYQKYKSMSGILRHLDIKRNPRCCKLIAQKIQNVSGTEEHSKKFSKKILSIDEIRVLAAKCSSKTEVMRQMGMEPYSGNYTRISDLFKEHNIILSPIKQHSNRHQKSYSEDEVYCKKSNYSKHALVQRVFNEKWLEYTCQECGISDFWNNKKLKLQLDHKNGISNDNRKENLRWLCPNCHSQTPTFSGKKNLMARQEGIEPPTKCLISDGNHQTLET